MRCLTVAVLVVAASPCLAFDEFRWPDPDIPVPARVEDFVLAECVEFSGSYEESVDECVRAERFAYRAVVTMLTEAETSARAAERYRICSGGLGRLGGKFHRRKAACIGKPLRIAWRFEFMQKAALERDEHIIEAKGGIPEAFSGRPDAEATLSVAASGPDQVWSLPRSAAGGSGGPAPRPLQD